MDRENVLTSYSIVNF